VESELLHRFKNQLAIAVGLGDLLLDATPEDDARRADLVGVRDAVGCALELLPQLIAQLSRSRPPNDAQNSQGTGHR
jgi:hypothetical protein